jgi:hypothetical protein
METGHTFYRYDRNGTRIGSHLQILIRLPKCPDGFAVINATTNPRGDFTTELTTNDHPTLTRSSFIIYKEAMRNEKARAPLLSKLRSGEIRWSVPLENEVLIRVMKGAIESHRSPEWLVKLARDELMRLHC